MKSAEMMKKSYKLLQLDHIVGSNTSELTGKRNSVFKKTTPAHIIELAEASFMNLFTVNIEYYIRLRFASKIRRHGLYGRVVWRFGIVIFMFMLVGIGYRLRS